VIFDIYLHGGLTKSNQWTYYYLALFTIPKIWKHLNLAYRILFSLKNKDIVCISMHTSHFTF
jgi:hypothetical protein